MRRFSVHPVNPQRRLMLQAADQLRSGAVVAMPTDACYVLACHLGDKAAVDRLRQIRGIDDKHLLTLMCRDLSELAQYAQVDNRQYRFLKEWTPGAYTFILPATKEVPRRLLHPKKKTVGVRIPRHTFVQALLAELGEPLLSSTLLLPDEEDPLTQGWEIKERLDHVVDAVVDSGDCGAEPTTVVDFSSGVAEVVRRGTGDPSRFE
jgi:tRNA threonylcarbamoyl adenosine modification protein (Sua5/YciO/YrdC/YwlC family)